MFITRLDVDKIDKDLMNYKYNSGFYFEKDIDNLREIVFNLVKDKEQLKKMREANLRLAKPDATKKIADILVSIAK